MRHCTTLWGDAAFSSAPLRTVVIEDAIYLPFSPTVFLDRDPDWGIYTSDGFLVREAAYLRGERRELVGQSLYNANARASVTDEHVEEMVYGGPIMPHFGHFLISSLARLWAAEPDRPFLFHSSPPVFDHRAPYIQAFVAAAGLTPRNCLSFDKPTRIRRLIVPEPSIVEQASVAAAYSASAAKIGDAFAPTGLFDGQRCYLSKARLTRGIAGLFGEEVIEEAFHKAGFLIVRPELLSIAEQVDLFRSASIIAGTASSSFHAATLVPQSESLRVVFSYSDTLNSNFSLIDYGLQGRSLYLSLKGHVEPTSRPDFLSYYRALNPKRLADEMVATVHALRPERTVRPASRAGASVSPVDQNASPATEAA